MTRKRLALLTVGLVLGAPLAIGGLATAGITLPDAAQAPFDELGVELPNQASADEVRAVIDSTPPGERACEFGQQVAQAANDGRAGPGEDPCAQQENLDGGQNQNGAAVTQNGTGNAQNANVHAELGRSFGQATAADAQQNASQDGRAFGERISAAAKQLGSQQSQAAHQNAGAGQGIAEQNSQIGQQIAEQHLPAGPGAAAQAPGVGRP